MPVTEEQILCESTHVKCPEEVNPQTQSRLLAARTKGEGVLAVVAEGRGFLSGEMKMSSSGLWNGPSKCANMLKPLNYTLQLGELYGV